MELKTIFKELYLEYGKQYWWPAKTIFEICIGAILTQNTSWTNVEKAIKNLRKERLLNIKRMQHSDEKKVASLIRASGYYNQKAKTLKLFCDYIAKNYTYNLEKFFEKSIKELRDELLSINGIGKETADSIILYGAKKPIFVIDAYTKRIINRICGTNYESYEELQTFFHENLKPNVTTYNEFHALLVKHAKLYCKKQPCCEGCFLKNNCNFYQNNKKL